MFIITTHHLSLFLISLSWKNAQKFGFLRNILLNFVWHINITGAVDGDVSDLFSDTSDISYQSDIEYLSNSKIFDISNGSPLNNENFNLLHFNINSITAVGRLDELTYVCRLLNIAVLVITDSKLDKNNT